MELTEQAYTVEFGGAGGKTGEGRAKHWRCGQSPGLGGQALRNRAKAAAGGEPDGAGSRAVTPEERGLPRSRAENGRLKREPETIKKAAERFAKDAL